MIRGLMISAGALSPLTRAQEILANNLANVNTSGFKEDRFAFHRELEAGTAAAVSPATGTSGAASGKVGSAASGTAGSAAVGGARSAVAGTTSGGGSSGGGNVGGSSGGSGGSSPAAAALAPQLAGKVDLAPGSFETTGSPLHLAISGPAFFAVQTPEGELYTRDGSFQRATDGTVTTRSGYPVLTDGGTLTVSASSTLSFGADGTAYVDGAARGKLKLMALPDAGQVTHAGSGLVRSAQPAQADATSRVVQGSVEGANVDAVTTMVQMTELLHDYQANQQAILTQDGSLGQLIQWASS